jgi:type IV pilus assembly protein PilA
MLRRTSSGFTLIELMIVVAIIAILAAIALPNFARFQVRSRQSEARTNLRGIFTTLESARAETGNYTNCAGFCGFLVEGQDPVTAGANTATTTNNNAQNNRYVYTMTPNVIPRSVRFGTDCVAAGTFVFLDGTPGAIGALGKQETAFLVQASANLDNDPTCDIMGITQLGGILISNAGNNAGNPAANRDDDSIR